MCAMQRHAREHHLWPKINYTAQLLYIRLHYCFPCCGSDCARGVLGSSMRLGVRLLREVTVQISRSTPQSNLLKVNICTGTTTQHRGDMADVSMNAHCTRKMSFANGKINGVESKTPFLIGVSGGTASGKVNYYYKIFNCFVDKIT